MKRLARTAQIIRLRGEIPDGLVVLLTFGLLPLPLFFDEVALVVAMGWLWVGYRTHVRAAWREAGLTNATT